MNDYTAAAANLLPVAMTRAAARDTDVVAEFWRLYDLAEGLGEALRWLDDDSPDTHPVTVRDARIVSVGEPAQGCPVRWRETDRDGQTSERDANLGSLRNPAVRAVHDTARALAGTDRPCTIVVAYQPNDEGWETKDERGKTIRPSHFRRIARITPHRAPTDEQAPRTERPSPAPAQRRPEPERIAEPAPAPQPSLADAEPPAVILDGRPADAALLAIAGTLSAEALADESAPLPAEVFDAYKGWFTGLAKAGGGAQGRLRTLNKEAQRTGRGVASIHGPATVGDLFRLVNLTRDLLAEQGATA